MDRWSSLIGRGLPTICVILYTSYYYLRRRSIVALVIRALISYLARRHPFAVYNVITCRPLAFCSGCCARSSFHREKSRQTDLAGWFFFFAPPHRSNIILHDVQMIPVRNIRRNNDALFDFFDYQLYLRTQYVMYIR